MEIVNDFEQAMKAISEWRKYPFGCDIQYVDFSAAEISDVNLTNFEFSNCTMRNVKFVRSFLNGTQFKSTDLTGVTFTHCCGRDLKIEHSSAAEIYVLLSHFDNAELIETAFNDAVFEDSSLVSSVARGCQFLAAQFKRCNLSSNEWHSSSFVDATFIESNVDFSSFELSCCFKHVHMDRRMATQYIAHLCSMYFADADINEAVAKLRPLAEQSHRAKDLLHD